MITADILSDADEDLDFAVQSGLRRVRSWRVPPNWSRGEWVEELTAVGTAAAWQAVCEFDPARGVPLAGFRYCRIVSQCLARYRKEWRYALHLAPSDSRGTETTTFERVDLTASSAAKIEDTRCSNDHLRGVVSALPTGQRRLIEQLFWEERTEIEVANTMSINQSTINRRKRAILNRLRAQLGNRDEFKYFLHKDSPRCNLNNSFTGSCGAVSGLQPNGIKQFHTRAEFQKRRKEGMNAMSAHRCSWECRRDRDRVKKKAKR